MERWALGTCGAIWSGEAWALIFWGTEGLGACTGGVVLGTGRVRVAGCVQACHRTGCAGLLMFKGPSAHRREGAICTSTGWVLAWANRMETGISPCVHLA